jgi:sulfoxide reductase heme-binding subunit YedZ
MLALGLSYYARAKIGVQRWRVLHRFTALAWVLGLAHSLGEGTDAGQVWFLAMTAIVVAPALVLLVGRWLRLPKPAGAPRVGATR